MSDNNEPRSNIRELKTERDYQKEEMLSYLDFLRDAAKENRLNAAIFVADLDNVIDVQAIGDVNEMEVVGLLDTAKLSFQTEFT